VKETRIFIYTCYHCSHTSVWPSLRQSARLGEKNQFKTLMIRSRIKHEKRERQIPRSIRGSVGVHRERILQTLTRWLFLTHFPLIFLLQAALERLSCASRGIKVTLLEQCGSRKPASLRIQTPETPTNSTHGHRLATRHTEHFIREKSTEITGREPHITSNSLFDPDGGTRVG